MKEAEKKTQITDGFYIRRTGGDAAAGGWLNRCASRYIQNGKPCPMFETCKVKNEVREIL